MTMSAIGLNQLLYQAKHDPGIATLIREGRIDETGAPVEPDEVAALARADIVELARRGVIPNLLLVAARIHAIPAGDLGRILSDAEVGRAGGEES